jgi:hypothetical protein
MILEEDIKIVSEIDWEGQMLVYVLALLVGLGSFALYMVAFFLPEVHRRYDFIWSGVGLFYALALWIYAGRITGGVLLGQVACVTLLGWLGWQTLTMRRQLVDPDTQTPLPTVEELRAGLDVLGTSEGRSQLLDQASLTFKQVKTGMQGAIATAQNQDNSQSGAKSETRGENRGKTRGGAISKTMGAIDQPYVPPALEEFGTAGQEATERFAKASIAEVEKATAKAYRKASETVEAALAEAEATLQDVSQTVTEVLQEITPEPPLGTQKPLNAKANRRLPDQEAAEQGLPEQKLPEQELPEQELLEQELLEQRLSPNNDVWSNGVQRNPSQRNDSPVNAIPRKVSPSNPSFPEASTQPSILSRNPVTKLGERSPNPIQAITETLQGWFKGFSKKKDAKPVYVRKQYREEAEIPPQTIQNSPIDATVEEMVEDLLEDISAQESASSETDQS